MESTGDEKKPIKTIHCTYTDVAEAMRNGVETRDNLGGKSPIKSVWNATGVTIEGPYATEGRVRVYEPIRTTDANGKPIPKDKQQKYYWKVTRGEVPEELKDFVVVQTQSTVEEARRLQRRAGIKSLDEGAW